jgi:ATP phosphoribosyltransferase regulatory subunit
MSQSFNNGERWLLPVGVEETLPEEAERIEQLRRKVLDLLDSWGYQLVMPPLMEFLDSLLTGVGHGLEIETFKLTDQVSGKMMGVRADMTPQVARIDAHYLRSNDKARRLCYFGPVLRTRPDCLGCTRVPLQLGAELFGIKGNEADIEVVELLVETLKTIGLQQLHVDLGHMGIFQGLVESEQLDEAAQDKLAAVIISRARDDVASTCDSLGIADPARRMFMFMASCSGEVDTLGEVSGQLSSAPGAVLSAMDNLVRIATSLKKRLPNIRLYYDLAALKGQSYHNGLVFSVYTPGSGRTIATGGRYDNIGVAFGSARPATGFSLDLRTVSRLVGDTAPRLADTVYADFEDDPALFETVRELRNQGRRVIYCYDGEQPDTGSGTRSRLHRKDGKWVVE